MSDTRDITIDDLIFEVEDYIGGNIEGVKRIDRMGLTVFLRRMFETALEAERKRIKKALPEITLSEVIEAKQFPSPEEYEKMVWLLGYYKEKVHTILQGEKK